MKILKYLIISCLIICPVAHSEEYTEAEQPQKYTEEILLDKEIYSYNESENQNSGEIKTKYDFNINDSQMSVGIRGFSFSFPVSRK